MEKKTHLAVDFNTERNHQSNLLSFTPLTLIIQVEKTQ